MEIAQEIAQNFGLEWPKFIAQVLIFGIVYYVLKQKAFGPILSMLEVRRKHIEELEADRKKVKERLAAAEAEAKNLRVAADKEAGRLIEEARASANALREKRAQEATLEAGQIIAKAREATQMEREEVFAELRRDFGRLLVSTTATVTGKVLTKSDQDTINEEAASQIAL
ncbi:MAG: ATP synthase F0 subunit B [Verrucomicrobia bacterium]|nr:ATP synthase F0 subunit B [Verrucomicrobiota bacterium]